MPVITLRVLGSLCLERDGQPIALATRKAGALLAYLALSRERHSRDWLAALLWPESDQIRAHGSLRYTLAVLKHALNGAGLQADRKGIACDRIGGIWVDAVQFETLVASCAAHRHPPGRVCPGCVSLLTEALALVRGEFLEGFGLRDSPAFDAWQRQQAEHFSRQQAWALERLVRHYADGAEYGPALGYARRWLVLDPLHEPAHQSLIRLYAACGESAAALQQYRECEQVLWAELGTTPAAETRGLIEALRRSARADTERRARSIRGPGSADQPAVFVAREAELARLDGYLQRALAGQGQVVFVTGEAGRGKTALLHEFARRAAAHRPDLVLAGGTGNAHTGSGDPYLPFRDILAQLTDLAEFRSSGTRLPGKGGLLPLTGPILVKDGLGLIDSLVPGAAVLNRAAALHPGLKDQATWQTALEQRLATPSAQSLEPQVLLEQYAAVLLHLADEYPCLLLLDDLQWLDTASVDLLFHLGRRLECGRVLLVGAYRAEDVALGRNGQRHPLAAVVLELQRILGEIKLDLDAVDEGHARCFVDALLDSEPNRLGPEFRTALTEQTGGHPLFTVELWRALQARRGVAHDANGRWVEHGAVQWAELPARVEGVIAERIGRLDPACQELLTIASVEGEVFTAEVAARVQAVGVQETIRRLSRTLDREQHLVRAGGGCEVAGQRLTLYGFRHSLFQKYLYQRLDAGERAYLHRAVGATLEALYGQQAETIAVSLARHFAEAGPDRRAAGYLLLAGNAALHLSAHEEAIVHLRHGLDLLESLPPGEDYTRLEMQFQLSLGVALAARLGVGSVEAGRVYGRAAELCRRLDGSALGPALFGLHGYYLLQAEFSTALELAGQLLDLAERTGDAGLLAVAHLELEITYVHLGQFSRARDHYQQVLAHDLPGHRTLALQFGMDPQVAGGVYGAIGIHLPLGEWEQAVQQAQAAYRVAEELDHPYSLAYAQIGLTVVHALRREWRAAQEQAEAAIALATKERFPLWAALARAYRGLALAEQGQGAAGITEIQAGMAAWRATGAKMALPMFLGLLAQAHLARNQTDAGLKAVDQALEEINRTGERWWATELGRVRTQCYK